MILSPEKDVLTHTKSNYIGTRPNDDISLGLKNIPQTQVLLENNSILDIASPVLQDNKIIGWARVGIGQEYIQENLLGIVRNGIVYMIIALIIGFLVAISVGNRLNKGLYSLIDTTDKIREGDRKLRVSPFQTVEISKLGTAFNQMLDEISANERLLAMVLENLPVGVFVLKEDGVIRSSNAAGKEIWKDIRYVGVEKYGEYKAWFTDTKQPVKPNEWGAAIALRTGNRY
jgi:PAS domain-containing protein